MSKVAVVYWSGTGNTEAMAYAVEEGAKDKGAEVSFIQAADFSADQVSAYDAIAFGCPAMGDEVLEESEFDPMFTDVEAALSGKKIALFGSYGWGDGQWMRDWEDRCRAAGAELVTDSDGAVTGAKVHNDTGSFTISAKKIIVACGGASWNTSMVPEKSTGIDVHEKTQIGSTGDGMNMLQQIGAQMSSEDIYIKSSQPDYADEFHNDWSNTPSNGMALLIDSEGKRFTNEAPATATILNKKMIDHASSSYWFLIDDDNTIGYDDDYFAKVKEFAADDDVKAVVHADSLEELAGKLGVDAGTLKQTVEDYNSACAAGKDDEFGKDAQYLKAYPEDGGFYAVYQRIGSWGTIGGAIVDEQQHVLDADGNVIPNVFAAGETATAQLFGDYYFGGFSLGLYTTAGRIAAEQAVAEIQQ